MRTVNTILPCAQALLYTLMGLMPSPYQMLSLQAVLTMFWEPQRVALPEQCVLKSPAALSRFLNEYGWPTRAVIRATRKQILQELLKYAPRGRRPHLQVIIDLTTLEKRGKFKAFAQLIHILNGKAIKTITKKGQRVQITGFKKMVTASWFYLERNGKLEKRFVISTRVLKGNTITWWGRRRWAIEGFFKTAKYQFGLARLAVNRLY